jgi:hypothetical protein
MVADGLDRARLMDHNEWNRSEILMPEKGPPVFLDYDQAALDAAYDQAAYAGEPRAADQAPSPR